MTPREKSLPVLPEEVPVPIKNGSIRQQFIDYFVFTVCTSLYLLPFMRLLLLGTDEGLFISGAVKVAEGQVFARDFFEIVGPGTFYWVGLFFKLFGVTFAAAHACLFVTSLGTGLLMYFLSRRVCAKYRVLPTIIVTGTSFGMIWPTVSHHVNSNFISLAAVACAIFWIDSKRNVLLLLAGSLAGITTFFHLPKGLFLIFALFAWLLIQYWQRKTPLLSSSGWLFLGYCSVIGIVGLYFGSQHALWDLFNANYLFPSQHYGAVNAVPYGSGIFVHYWENWVGASARSTLAVAMASILIIPFLLIAVLPVLLPLVGIWKRKSLDKPEITLYWLCGCALWLAEYHRRDIWHLVFGSPLLIILCVFYFERGRSKIEDMVLQIMTISSVCLILFNLVLALTARPMMTRVGSVAVYNQDPIVEQLNRVTNPGDEIFVYPYDPIYYFLTETKNPSRFSGLMYSYNSQSEFEDMVQTLEQHRTRYVLWDAGYYENMLKQGFPSATPVRSDQLVIEPYLTSHYRVIWTMGETRLLERNDWDSSR